jgi:hypothetical protein
MEYSDGLRAQWPGFEVQKISLSFITSRPALGLARVSIQRVLGLFPLGKRGMELEADYSI